MRKLMALIVLFGSLLWHPGILQADENQSANVIKQDGRVFCFDMSTSNSPVWEGFTRVTPATTYNPESGYGWTNSPGQLRNLVSHTVYKLALDSIAGSKGAGDTHWVSNITFRVDLPNGNYVVWVLTGAMSYKTMYDLGYMLHPHELYLQGQKAARIEPKEEDIYSCANYDWKKGDDIYDYFIARRFTWLKQAAVVTNRQLQITFANAANFPISAIVVAGQETAEEIGAKLKELDAQRKRNFNELWQFKKPEPDEPANVSEKERKTGYIAAETDCAADLHPWCQPPYYASRERMRAFGTPGEQRQMSFAVYALKDLHDVTYEVTDLISSNANRIAASALERGLVQFIPFIKGSIQTIGGSYSLAENLILPVRPTYIGKDTCKRFWLTLRIPDNAVPGIYVGRINISASNAPPGKMDLYVRVLPFKLPEPPKEHFFYFGTMLANAKSLDSEFNKIDYYEALKDKRYWEVVRAEVRFLKENEFCRAECIIGQKRIIMKDKQVVDVDLEPTYKLMDLIREENAWPRDNKMVFADGPHYFNAILGGHVTADEIKRIFRLQFVPTPEGRSNFIRAVQITAEKARQAGWPEVVFELGGELDGYQGGADFGIAAYTAFKAAGVITALRGAGKADMEVVYKGVVDYPELANLKAEWMDYIRTHCKGLWAYNAIKGRFGSGWFCFKHGITRVAYEMGIGSSSGQPNNAFDAAYTCLFLQPTSLMTFPPNVFLKRWVDGAIDYKYLYLLDLLIKEGEKSKRAEAVKISRLARTYLDEKLSSLPKGEVIRPLEPGGVPPDVSPGSNLWKLSDFDRYRWEVAEYILAIRKALGKETE